MYDVLICRKTRLPNCSIILFFLRRHTKEDCNQNEYLKIKINEVRQISGAFGKIFKQDIWHSYSKVTNKVTV